MPTVSQKKGRRKSRNAACTQQLASSGKRKTSAMNPWWLLGIAASARAALQNSYDRRDRVPIPGRRRHAVKLVDLAKIADRLHVTTVLSEHELPLGGNHPHQPLAISGKHDRKRRPDTPGF